MPSRFLDPLPEGVAEFYLNVSETDGDPSFSGINKLNFQSNDFYITQNAPNTDEVVVNFRGSSGGVSGEINTASNLGAGQGIFSQKVGVDLQFKSLVEGTNITLSSDSNQVTINSSASGGGGGGFYGIIFEESGNGEILQDDTLVFNANHFYLGTNGRDKPILSLRDYRANPSYVATTGYTNAATSAAEQTFTHIFQDNPNRFAIIGILLDHTEAPPIDVKIGGVRCSRIRTSYGNSLSNGDVFWSCYGMINPPAGEQVISITPRTSIVELLMFVSEFKDVNQISPIGQINSDIDTAGSNNPDVALTPTTIGSTIFCMVGAIDGASDPYTFNTATGVNQFETQSGTAANSFTAAVGTIEVTPSNVETNIDVDWTMSSSAEWAIIAFEVLPANSGSENVFFQKDALIKIYTDSTDRIVIPNGQSTATPIVFEGSGGILDLDTGPFRSGGSSSDRYDIAAGSAHLFSIREEGTSGDSINLGSQEQTLNRVGINLSTIDTRPSAVLHVGGDSRFEGKVVGNGFYLATGGELDTLFVGETDDTPFLDSINTIVFNSSDFYITQNISSDKQAIVNIRGLSGLYTLVRDEKASTTDGGTFTSGAWQTRVLNTNVIDEIGITLSSNQVILPAGTYRFRGEAPAYEVNRHQTRLFNITDNTTIAVGKSCFAAALTGAGVFSVSSVSGQFKLSSTKTIELQHRCETTNATLGFGLATSFGLNEVYASLELIKVA